MAFREVNVPLKFPGTADELIKLGNTILEGVVYGTYKDVLLGEQEYEMEAVVFIMRGNMMLSFTPQFAGVHTARIFSDGREICKPVVFRITLGGQPVREDGGAKRGTLLRSRTLKSSISTTFSDDGSEDASVFTQNSTISRYARSDSQILEGRTGTARMDSGINLLNSTGMPVAIPEEAEGPLGSPVQQHFTTFNDLYSQKYAGVKFAEADVEATKKEVLHATLGPDHMLTTETIKLLEKDASNQMKKKPCEICTKKRRAPRRIDMWGFCFCNSCFKRQYFKHSTLEHFMVPSVKQVKVDIPVDKKFGKRAHYIPVMKCLPQVNLRGLTVDIVRQVQADFKQYCVANDGWIDNVFILPMIKSHLTNTHSLTDQQVSFLLSTRSFKAMMESMGLKDRDKVHEVEYLSLIAFVTREKHLLGPTKSTSKSSDFTTRDLAVVYAVKGSLSPSAESSSEIPYLPQRKISSAGISLNMTPDYAREAPIGALARSEDIIPAPRPKRASVNEDMRLKRASVNEEGFRRVSINDDTRFRRASVNEGMRFKQLSDSSMQADQLTKVTREKGERGEITPLHHKISRGAPTTEELMDQMKLTGSSADAWMLY